VSECRQLEAIVGRRLHYSSSKSLPTHSDLLLSARQPHAQSRSFLCAQRLAAQRRIYRSQAVFTFTLCHSISARKCRSEQTRLQFTHNRDIKTLLQSLDNHRTHTTSVISHSSRSITPMLPSAHRKNVDHSSAVAMVCRRPSQWIGLTLTQPQEPTNGDHGLSLPRMPNKILSAIIDLAGSENLPALRLTNKHLCAVANTPFATLHFSERKHVQSAHSMDALIEITAHPFFGKFVKTVIICGSRSALCAPAFHMDVARTCRHCIHPQPSPSCGHPDPSHVHLDSERLRVKLNEVFFNIGRHSSSVSVGVNDSTSKCYGSEYYNGHCTMLSDKRSVSSTKKCGLRFQAVCTKYAINCLIRQSSI
jgi:hypothetical protein